LNGDTYAYRLEGNNLVRYEVDGNVINQSSPETIIVDVSSWCGLDDEYGMIFTKASDGDIYYANLDGNGITHVMDAHQILIKTVKSNDKQIEIYYTTDIKGVTNKMMIKRK